MKYIKRSAGVLCTSVFIFHVVFSAVAQAAISVNAPRGVIVKTEGQVYVINELGEKNRVNENKYIVNSNETVITHENSKAVLQLNDGAMSVLNEKSSLRVERSGWLSQLGGRVYYIFRKIFGKEKSRKVRTKFATIGIRGTTFIVDASSDNQQVALQEGELNIESPADDYEIHKTKLTADEYNAFKQRTDKDQKMLNSEYSEYKKNINTEFVEYKKNFDLQANKVVSFNGNRVNENNMNKEWESSFSDFADFSRDFISEYKKIKND